jgi:hypothetical protein
MKTLATALALAALACSTPSVAQDNGPASATNWFGSLYINPRDDNPGPGYFYAITTPVPSGVAGCPNARYFFFRTNAAAAKEMTAAILYARSTNRQVYFHGYCQVDVDRFRIVEVVVAP